MKNYSLEELFCEWQKATPEDRAEAMALLRGEGNAVENCSQLERSENISCRFLLSGHEKKIRELESELTNLKRANEKLELEAKALKDADRILVDVKAMFQKLQDSISPNSLEASCGDDPLMKDHREAINEDCRRIRSQKAVDSEKNVRAPYL
ncbi:MAG: hypothetical protein WC248_04905, partial [Candidatus Methanomethylophilaceae archaeon]